MTLRRYGAQVLASVHLDFSNVGWDAAVAIATLLLALFTWRLAKRTTELARSTAAEVRASLRPALIHPADGPQAVVTPAGVDDPVVLRLPMMNAGRGPALNAYAYALIATSEGSRRTDLASVGNVAPDHLADVVIPDVPDGDHGRDPDRAHPDRAHYTAFATVIYEDLAGRSFHTVVALADPRDGLPVERPSGYVGLPLPRLLAASATQTGEGEAPPAQWRVTFTGPDITDDQRERLGVAAVLLFGGHSAGIMTGPMPSRATSSRWSAYAAGDSDRAAIAVVSEALDDERFVAFDAKVWPESRWHLEDVQRRARWQRLLRRVVRWIGRIPLPLVGSAANLADKMLRRRT